MLCTILTLVVTAGGLGAVTFLAGRRLAAHVRTNPAAMPAIIEHVVLPLLTKRPEEPPTPAEAEPEPPPE